MKNSQQNSSKTIIEMNNDQVYEIGDMLIITTRRRVITDGEKQGVMMIYSPNHTETKKQELIGKIYPRFTDEKTGKEYEGFLPANGLIVEMHLKDRFYKLVAEIEEDFLNEMRLAAKNDELKLLTAKAIAELKGTRIQTIYFGYAKQDGVNDFIVGELVKVHTLFGNQDVEFQKEASKNYFYDYEVLTATGKKTYIRTNINPDNPDNGIFYCSDQDRFVQYRVVK